jgi:hypothetical protein
MVTDLHNAIKNNEYELAENIIRDYGNTSYLIVNVVPLLGEQKLTEFISEIKSIGLKMSVARIIENINIKGILAS